MIGLRLKQAREAIGLRQDDAADALGIAKSGISAMESGGREPKVAQLAKLARLYKRSIEFFFEEASDLPQKVVLWRCKPKEETVVLERQREFLQLCEDYAEIERLTDSVGECELPSEGDISPLEYNYDRAAALAGRIWREFELGITPAVLLPNVLEERFFVKIFAMPMQSDASALCTRGEPLGACIMLNQDNRSWRRNFDLAHELFHLLTWRIFRSPDDDTAQQASENEERFAGCFAGNLLLPEGPFREHVLSRFVDGSGNFRITPIQLHEIARRFDVSAEAVIYRCATLLRWRKEKTQSIVAKLRDFVVEREDQASRELPRRYTYLVVRAYREGLTSLARAAKYLRENLRDARAILEPPGDGEQADTPITVAAD